jgi:sugar phosphate isomerase/epimerase
MKQANYTRRDFLKTTTAASAAFAFGDIDTLFAKKTKVQLCAHLWVYAAGYPPTWDCSPVMDTVLADLKMAGIQGLEVMELHIREAEKVKRLKELSAKHGLPISGTSYGAAMWNKEKHNEIVEDIDKITTHLAELGGKTFGISVGNAGHKKTDDELDAQAEVLKKTLTICLKRNIVPNLHNHTYEVADGMHDLRGTLKRLPDFKLGPDINWLVRGGINPVDFIQEFGSQMVYLHIRDQTADGKWTEGVGNGATDWKGIAAALKKVNFSGMAAIELAHEKDFKLTRPLGETWQLSRKFVKKTMGWK